MNVYVGIHVHEIYICIDTVLYQSNPFSLYNEQSCAAIHMHICTYSHSIHARVGAILETLACFSC